MLDIARRWVPWTYEAFEQYRLKGVNLSAKGWDVVKGLIDGTSPDQAASGLSKREWRELMALLGREEG